VGQLVVNYQSVVPRAGFEPARAEAQRILSPSRLPVPPPRHFRCCRWLMDNGSRRGLTTLYHIYHYSDDDLYHGQRYPKPEHIAGFGGISVSIHSPGNDAAYPAQC
jgi:hypothetical protein